MNINMNLWSVETAELERIQREGNSSGKDYIFPVIGMDFSHPKDGIFPIQKMKSFPFQGWHFSKFRKFWIWIDFTIPR